MAEGQQLLGKNDNKASDDVLMMSWDKDKNKRTLEDTGATGQQEGKKHWISQAEATTIFNRLPEYTRQSILKHPGDQHMVMMELYLQKQCSRLNNKQRAELTTYGRWLEKFDFLVESLDLMGMKLEEIGISPP